ncbi:MAG: alpha/beta hydrolase [Planctomycetota bacterium]
MERVLAPSALLVLAPLVAGPLHGAPQDGAADEPELRVERIQARDKTEVLAEYGTLEVPENRSDPESRRITLAYLRVRSKLEQPGPPVFVLAGGPGGSSIRKVKYCLENGGTWYVDLLGGDVVAIDQRGVGLSEPNLETDARYELPLDVPGDPEEHLKRIREVCREEAARWRAKGVDLAGYTTVESADDIDAVRRALGYDSISLWGESYGTHLAMATLRRHGEHVARLLLFGPEGPDHTLKLPSYAEEGLARIGALAAADPKLGPLVPDLVGLVREVLDKLDDEPVYVDVDGERVGISRFDVQMLLAYGIGTMSGSGDQVPARVLEMAAGDFEAFGRELLKERQDGGVWSAMQMMMDCASGATEERTRRIAKEAETCLLGDAVNFPFGHVADAWDAPDLGDAFRGPLRSDAPVLFVVGDLDSRTPIRNAEELMEGLPNAQLLVVGNAGHGDVNWLAPDLRAAWSAFLHGEEVETTRVEQPKPTFELPR